MSSSMTVVVKKRERTQNWIPEEKNALFSLIKLHARAIENKKIDATASAMKTLAWQQIHSVFRGRFSTDRDIVRMREQWRRMKAQARLEIYSFAEKVRTLGPEEASKNQPSTLSIEVWRLMERSRNHNDETGLSNGSDRDEKAVRPEGFQRLLDNMTNSSTPTVSVHEMKVEANSDGFNEHNDEQPRNSTEQLFQQPESENGQLETTATNQKRTKMNEDSLMNIEQGGSGECSSDVFSQLYQECQHSDVQKAIWIFEATQQQHNLKLEMLHLELQRAELQRQAALNELKISELKKHLIENQAAEFHR
ncbi:uncharacterized protein LOC107220885 [Neodiprion lecontei]|uniref:Regulatory protein zeste n=2 Tax=Neodiprion TaxID=270857 RepID=A0A6J0BMU9_NEOLC|nr:uncharacterized protein LOC107220885 [Neodiprion lecontei]XP_046476496.1 uncharacterized protein LOC124216249 [Neodiprion pinetum]